jgi:hypothetical protein
VKTDITSHEFLAARKRYLEEGESKQTKSFLLIRKKEN